MPQFLGLLHVADQHAGGLALEERHRQGQQYLERAGGQAGVDLVGQEQHQPLAGIGEHGIERGDHAEHHQHGQQRLLGVIRDDAIDNDMVQ